MNPGSPVAVKHGCMCAIIDNCYGKGFSYSSAPYPCFWINSDCPMHGTPCSNGEAVDTPHPHKRAKTAYKVGK